MLNTDQKRVFDKVKAHFLHQKEHEANKCACNLTPLRMFVSGVGGTDKSFLIETIKSLVGHLWPTDDLTCAVAAPTGLAAFNVGGITIHRLFQLPVEHEGKTAGYWALSKASQKVMKTTLRSVKVFIIDEVSMVSSLNLTYMHLRLEELFGSNDWFGFISNSSFMAALASPISCGSSSSLLILCSSPSACLVSLIFLMLAWACNIFCNLQW